MSSDWVPRDEDGEEWWTRVPEQTLQVALTLSQAVWWVDSESTPHLIDTMSPAHRAAVIEYLVLQAPSLLLAVQETAARARSGSASQWAARTLLRATPFPTDSAAWLEATPLMVCLRQYSARNR